MRRYGIIKKRTSVRRYAIIKKRTSVQRYGIIKKRTSVQRYGWGDSGESPPGCTAVQRYLSE